MRMTLNSAARRDLALGFIVLLLFGLVTAAFPQFARPGNLGEVLDDSAILILLALGQMLVILTRGIDLSIAANLALSGMLVALLNKNYPDLGVAPVLLIAIVSGTLLGAMNGLLVWRFKLPPIVVTLGTMSVYRGLIYLLSGGTWVNDNQMSPPFLAFIRYELLGLTVLSWLALIGVAIFAVVMRYTVLGRNLY